MQNMAGKRQSMEKANVKQIAQRPHLVKTYQRPNQG